MLSGKVVVERLVSFIIINIDVQNQVKYGGQMDFFLSRCFRKLLNTGGFGIKVRHWINISAGTELLSLLKLLTDF